MNNPPRSAGLIKLTIMAVGGQGGGVLTNWIEALARAQGYAVQATSVAGVAQRTGATIYYIEMTPKTDAVPIFALAPAAGDVDILIAAELMEAGRAIQRGFVTPDRTTLVASSHRALAVSEKMVPGDGISDATDAISAAKSMAQKLVFLDGELIAVRNGSAISAALFGALAGSDALPFPVSAFEAAIRNSGKGVDASILAFRDAEKIARLGGEELANMPEPAKAKPTARGPARLMKHWETLKSRTAKLPEPVAEMATLGLRKVVAFQDHAYGAEYLDHLGKVLAIDSRDQGFELSREAAKYIANAMAYDDVIGVAATKTCATRTARVLGEVDNPDALQITEYFHPRTGEIVGLLPARLGAITTENPKSMARIERWFSKGRRIRSDRLAGFLLLYFLGGFKGWRRRTYRHQVERVHLKNWLNIVLTAAKNDYNLGCEILKTQRLIKGYSDTHIRGKSKYDRVIGALSFLEGRDDAAAWLRRLTTSALQDEEGIALDGAIKTVESL